MPDIHPQLLSIFARMLQAEPSMRQADMQEVKNELMAVRLDVGMSGSIGGDTPKPFDKAQAMKAELESVQAIDMGEPPMLPPIRPTFTPDRQVAGPHRPGLPAEGRGEEQDRFQPLPGREGKAGGCSFLHVGPGEARAQIGGRTPPPVRHAVTPSASPPTVRRTTGRRR